jgi:hypothetical protein
MQGNDGFGKIKMEAKINIHRGFLNGKEKS